MPQPQWGVRVGVGVLGAVLQHTLTQKVLRYQKGCFSDAEKSHWQLTAAEPSSPFSLEITHVETLGFGKDLAAGRAAVRAAR